MRDRKFCPICGSDLSRDFDHHCSPRSLAAIDRADARARHQDEDTKANCDLPFGERLDLGFGIVNGNSEF